MGKHRFAKEAPARWWPFGRKGDQDNLFARSFRTCTGCGEDVYVLAENCRVCGRSLELAVSTLIA